MDSRFFLVEKYGGPAGHKSGLPGEPQHHQQDEDDEDRTFSKADVAKAFILILHHLVGLFVCFVL